MSEHASQHASVSLPILGFTIILAFCSIVYELLLGQTLSAFLGNTVLRYSVTIGLYMFSMGIGALIAGPFVLKTPVFSLQLVELILAVLGAVSIPFLFLLDSIDTPVLVLSIIAHSLIIVIGVLSGLEIPLLVEVRSEVEHAASRILGVDYIGAFLGTVAFALLFYPKLGLFATAFVTATLNALVGLLLPFYLRGEATISTRLAAIQVVVFVCVVTMLIFYPEIEEYCLERYIGH